MKNRLNRHRKKCAIFFFFFKKSLVVNVLFMLAPTGSSEPDSCRLLLYTWSPLKAELFTSIGKLCARRKTRCSIGMGHLYILMNKSISAPRFTNERRIYIINTTPQNIRIVFFINYYYERDYERL